ncbi:MAG: HAD family hydrolase [Treponema sp.]
MKYPHPVNIEAVVFDIDGTLYPSWKFTLMILPFFIRHSSFIIAFAKVRKRLHQISSNNPEKAAADFFAVQNELLAQQLGITAEEAGAFLTAYIYTGWKKYFAKIQPYAGATEAVRQLKQAGLKIGILSDFPPEQKGNVWGILPLCDAAVGSEMIGALKPSRIPFRYIAEQLNTPLEKILYVGNSKKYDIAGAAAAGMKTAYIRPAVFSFLDMYANADIYFSNYRQFLKYMV